ncbi:MAG: hypothetical protein ACP5R4_09825 [Armatimonadota bacterium]
MPPESNSGKYLLNCPKCGAEVCVTQVQGDRCPGCRCEFKLFRPHERDAAEDYFQVLTGVKHMVALADGALIIAHQ